MDVQHEIRHTQAHYISTFNGKYEIYQVSFFFSRSFLFFCFTAAPQFNKIECDYILTPHETKKKLVFRTNWHEISSSKWKLVCVRFFFFQISSIIFVSLRIAIFSCFAFILPIAVSILFSSDSSFDLVLHDQDVISMQSLLTSKNVFIFVVL